MSFSSISFWGIFLIKLSIPLFFGSDYNMDLFYFEEFLAVFTLEVLKDY
jgi:hypothetical protein